MSALETLETRRMFATTAVLSAGVLTVTGDNAANWIVISNPAAGQIRVSDNGFANVIATFSAANVQKLALHGLDGADNLQNNISQTIPTTVYGGSGNDTIIGMNGADKLYGGNDNDMLIANNGNDSVYGGAGNDSIKGGWGNDMLYGEAGNDTFETDMTALSDGNDVISGGSGTDHANYAPRQAPLSLTLDNVANDGNLAAGEADNILTDVENVTGSGAQSDFIVGSALANSLNGNGGNDTIYGGDGNDTLNGSTGNDSLFGQGGNDLVIGFLGTDAMDGGAGIDTVSYHTHTADVTVTFDGIANDGAAGENDAISNFENIIGGKGNDTLEGDNAANYINGAEGNDVIRGFGGNDSLFGGTGNDWIHGGAGDDILAGEAGIDTLIPGEGNDTVRD